MATDTAHQRQPISAARYQDDPAIDICRTLGFACCLAHLETAGGDAAPRGRQSVAKAAEVLQEEIISA
jgi:hypothetical protein